jgi:hypothetical protein
MTRYRAEDQKGHAVHFLKRLDRASGDSAELALRLYHDPQMLRFVLACVRIPEGMDRVAVSLHEKDAGPFIVASENGRFVTCLGEGMSIKGLHLIPHAQLLAHMDKSEQYRERMELAGSIVGKGREVEKLMDRVMKKGDDLTREEMLGLSVIQPVLKPILLKWCLDSIVAFNDLDRALYVRRNLGKKEEPAVKLHWNTFWAAGHLALLASMNGPSGLEKIIGVGPTKLLGIFNLLLYSGDAAMALRLVWFIGKMGKSLLSECKRVILDPASAGAWLLGILGIIAIGLRHAKLKPQVSKALMASIRSLKDQPREVQRMVMEGSPKPETVLINLLGSLEEPDMTLDLYLEWCKKGVIETFKEAALPPEYTWDAAEKVPDELALAFGANASLSFHVTPSDIMHLIWALPWIARCEAHDFYYPLDFHRHIHIPWNPERAITMIETERKAWGEVQTVKAEKTPGRNDPCPCGSGKKYKKCCLREQPSPDDLS